MSLTKKIDFALVFKVKGANPNGDPLNGNRPRADFDEIGEVSDVCLKRKLRDRLQEDGESIFVQSDEKKTDGMPTLKHRAESDQVGLGKDAFNPKKSNKDETARKACEKWFDVRAFGQVFAFGKNDGADGVSIPVRGPVTIQSAFSLEPVSITSTQITKSVNNEGDGTKKSSDTMGTKHRVEKGVYVTYGAMTPQLAERTGFSDDDAAKIIELLPKLFEGDSSSARPEGSMEIVKLVWWTHNCKSGQYSSAKVHASLKDIIRPDGLFDPAILENALPGLKPEIIDGF